jgi:hypothetical protein
MVLLSLLKGWVIFRAQERVNAWLKELNNVKQYQTKHSIQENKDILHIHLKVLSSTRWTPTSMISSTSWPRNTWRVWCLQPSQEAAAVDREGIDVSCVQVTQKILVGRPGNDAKWRQVRQSTVGNCAEKLQGSYVEGRESAKQCEKCELHCFLLMPKTNYINKFKGIRPGCHFNYILGISKRSKSNMFIRSKHYRPGGSLCSGGGCNAWEISLGWWTNGGPQWAMLGLGL